MLVRYLGGAATGRIECLPLCLLCSTRRDGFEDQKIVETVPCPERDQRLSKDERRLPDLLEHVTLVGLGQGPARVFLCAYLGGAVPLFSAMFFGSLPERRWHATFSAEGSRRPKSCTGGRLTVEMNQE